LFECFSDCVLQSARTASVQRKIDMFESTDEIDHSATRYWSTGCGAKMRATAERSRFVNQAIACFSLEHWTRSISTFREGCSAGGPKCFRCNERFAFRQIRSASCQFKMTTLSPAHAIPLDRPLRKIDIYIPHFVERGLHFV
jgi:hypothetical protein